LNHLEQADRQLDELGKQRQQLDESISELQQLRDKAADTLTPVK